MSQVKNHAWYLFFSYLYVQIQQNSQLNTVSILGSSVCVCVGGGVKTSLFVSNNKIKKLSIDIDWMLDTYTVLSQSDPM